ncbi:hypothetical protein KMW28_19210 [Flammeovirga yaeyamensis]|uniref:Outer membrane protein beta-barrel domain-containing protein n=2 Tax=Flammeovirga yaeyamensis TaxID=367791 RepID=A0AAX1N362_9BACT|nr:MULTISPECIES: hypothetical protein [Flammeovirga]ANQ50851.2 hypothetical protein MY04_3500 [Flammeovirga sp. MY04]MBB3700751.1 hypothetical protein [Flammeovirga yaeyamensis]NMF37893.1 hypothetical protein [Flammeovirga yaeyamensis]QWG01746.1 hypothetical protein KMW28_19210 [Flammeovirga yaeyamensis]
MKNLMKAIALFFALFCSIAVSAQTYNYVDDSGEKKEEDQKQLKEPTQQEVDALKQQNNNGGSLRDRMFFGGGLGLGFSNRYTRILVSPMVGFKATENFHVGMGLVYEYYRQKDFPVYGTNYETHNYGIRPFARYLIDVSNGLTIFPQVEYYGFSYERIESYDARSNTLYTERQWQDQFLIGGGVSQRLGERGAANIIALYDLSWDSDTSYYNSPWVLRIEFAF